MCAQCSTRPRKKRRRYKAPDNLSSSKKKTALAGSHGVWVCKSCRDSLRNATRTHIQAKPHQCFGIRNHELLTFFKGDLEGGFFFVKLKDV